MSTLGKLYRTSFDEEDDDQWERQWVSTVAMKLLADIHGNLLLLDERIGLMVRGRPAHMNRFKIMIFTPTKGPGKKK